MLLNLVGSSNTDDKRILWKFINRFHKNVNPENNPILDNLTENAIKFFRNKLKPKKVYKKPNASEKKALKILACKKLKKLIKTLSQKKYKQLFTQ